MPVQFLYKPIDPDELTALYAAADVCFVSSIRDGMNLVCLEYVACQAYHGSEALRSSREDKAPGSLVLSTFAGAANHLHGALFVNPWDHERCAHILAHALSMDAAEASARMEKLGLQVEQQTR